MRSNCLFWALLMWARLIRPHGRRMARRCHIDARWSTWGPFLHFGVMLPCRDGRFRYISYKPTSPVRRRLPPLLFYGRVRWGDR